MRLPWLLSLCLLVFCAITAHSSPSFNPYSVLGVKKEASQDEIRRQYRKLCLKYHPDKNVQKSPKERKKCEETFKQLQKANELIGDEDSRRKYNSMETYSRPQGASPYGGSRTSTGSASMDEFYQDVYRRYYQRRPPPSTTAFYFNGVDISNLFPRGTPTFWTPRTSMKSIYIQKVKVPLQYLYAGQDGVEFPLQDRVWNRYAAASRGGCAASLLYESLAVSLSLIRMVRFPWSFLIGAVFFHFSLPKPTKLWYAVDLQAGWKTGTKLKFNGAEQGFDVVFILEEEKHRRYKRVGSDLHTFTTISEKERRKGCKIKIDPLDKSERPISISLKANQIRKSGDQVRIKGLGWPGRRGNPAGDLVVAVKVVRRVSGGKGW